MRSPIAAVRRRTQLAGFGQRVLRAAEEILARALRVNDS